MPNRTKITETIYDGGAIPLVHKSFQDQRAELSYEWMTGV